MQEDLEALAQARGVRLALQCEPEARVLAHAPDLRRAIWYLVEHAVDRSPVAGLVELSVVADTERASVVITHQGPGIAPADLPNWFEPFYPGHGGFAKEHQALRLAIAKRICESCSGSLTAANVAPQGVRFVMQLPLT